MILVTDKLNWENLVCMGTCLFGRKHQKAQKVCILVQSLFSL